MDFGSAIKSGFKNAFKFTGRASRSEFWWFFLFYMLCLSGGCALAAFLGGLAVSGGNDDRQLAAVAVLSAIGLFMLVFLFPILSLRVRRLHDSDKSGWLILIAFIPFGGFVLLIFYCLPGTQGPNQYGEDPLNPTVRVARTFD